MDHFVQPAIVGSQVFDERAGAEDAYALDEAMWPRCKVQGVGVMCVLNLEADTQGGGVNPPAIA